MSGDAMRKLRRPLSKTARKALLVRLRESGMTLQRVADAAGMSVSAVHNALSGAVPKTTVIGANGKRYPTHYSARTKSTTPPPVMHAIIVLCSSQQEQAALLSRLVAEGLDCDAITG